MVSRPGGLPIRTTFHLWSALALPYVYGAAALLKLHQIQKIQRKIHASMKSLAGSRVEPATVLADVGLPDAFVIRDLCLASLFTRLQTLPAYLVPAALHRYLQAQLFAATGYDGALLES